MIFNYVIMNNGSLQYDRCQHHEITEAVPLLAEKLHENVLLLQFKPLYKILNETYRKNSKYWDMYI